jgi:hypothetical protein
MNLNEFKITLLSSNFPNFWSASSEEDFGVGFGNANGSLAFSCKGSANFSS